MLAVREKPAGLAESDLVTALRSGWGIETVTIDYLPVGAGSYHWSVTEPSGRSWFVKVDRDDPDLRRSLATALALHRAGLDFVVAPVPALDGEVSHTLPHDSTSAAPQSLPRDSTDAASQSLPHDSTGTASRSLPHDSTGAATQSLPRDSTGAPSHSLRHDYTVAVFPLLDGAAGHFGPHPLADISEMSEMLGALHRTTRLSRPSPPAPTCASSAAPTWRPPWATSTTHGPVARTPNPPAPSSATTPPASTTG